MEQEQEIEQLKLFQPPKPPTCMWVWWDCYDHKSLWKSDFWLFSFFTNIDDSIALQFISYEDDDQDTNPEDAVEVIFTSDDYWSSEDFKSSKTDSFNKSKDDFEESPRRTEKKAKKHSDKHRWAWRIRENKRKNIRHEAFDLTKTWLSKSSYRHATVKNVIIGPELLKMYYLDPQPSDEEEQKKKDQQKNGINFYESVPARFRMSTLVGPLPGSCKKNYKRKKQREWANYFSC